MRRKLGGCSEAGLGVGLRKIGGGVMEERRRRRKEGSEIEVGCGRVDGEREKGESGGWAEGGACRRGPEGGVGRGGEHGWPK